MLRAQERSLGVDDIQKAFFFRHCTHIHHVLIENRRLPIGIGNRAGTHLLRFYYDPLWRSIVVIYFLWGGLRDLPILTELAVEIAARCRDQQGSGSWQDMRKRFLFDWIQMSGAWVSIHEAIVFSIPVFSDSARASFPFRDAASLGAQLTLDFTPAERSKKGREFRHDQASLTHLGLRGLMGEKSGDTREAPRPKLHSFRNSLFANC
jgi:hypothetical protein